MAKRLHLISFDVPFPANYGGVIDVFYKLKALSDLGVEITLHAFEYGRGESAVLNQYCKKVHYYHRHNHPGKLLNKRPYIVESRNNKSLLENLLKDNDPILFEGLHTTAFLDHPKLKDRLKLVRTHNIEHDYYEGLAEAEKKIFRRQFFVREAKKLKKYESILKHANQILAISESDKIYLEKQYNTISLVPAFHPNEEIEVRPELGNYVLYYGNLSVGENKKAVHYLLDNVFNQISYPVKIAGNAPDKELINKIKRFKHVELIDSPKNSVMEDLIRNAQVNVLPTFQSTGIKLKLLQALYSGRHCLVNTAMIEETGLESLCAIANSSDEFVSKLKELMFQEIGQDAIESRAEILSQQYNNKNNAQLIADIL